MKRMALGTALLALLFSVTALLFAALQSRPSTTATTSSSATMAPTQPAGATDAIMAAGPAIPPVKGYLDGREIRFIHTEASDPQVAQMLTMMMNSPVLVVPSLAQAPQSMLASVYVFTNGVKGDGPFGFQPDIFDSPPGSTGYSPLRAVHLVTWKDEKAARELKSAAEVKAAEADGVLKIERPGAVVNMPLLTWPGGQR